MNDIGKVFLYAIISIAVIVFIITAASGFFIFHNTSIKSKIRIEPLKILTTDGKKVDTLFIYKQP